ncbi:MAG TPA: HAMP domain-containing sensor histidine kinase [Chitinophagaceae bacterium]|nr:HAMP domain-containing sensor histidine kinase [Chitinophagaceae bacterium]
MLHSIINRGVRDYHDAEERRQINLLNISSSISFTFTFAFLIINIATRNWMPIVSNVLLLSFTITIFLINKLKYYTATIYILIIALSFFFVINAILFHNSMQYGIFLLMSFTILLINNKKGRIAMLAFEILLFLAFILLQNIPGLIGPPPVYKTIIGAIAFLLVFAVMLEYFKERLVQYHRRLTIANEQLIESNRVKEKMLSILSHDFYGPVGNLITSINLLDNQLFTPDEFHNTSEKLKLQLQVLTTSMKDVLQWSKMQIQGDIAEKVTIDLCSIFDEILLLFETPLLDKKLHLQNKIKAGTTAFANRDDLKLVFRNLVSNAIKFSNPGGNIFICAEKKGDVVKVSIMDEGTGMSRDMLDTLNNEQFSLFSTPGTAKEKGTGIGLMLVREFIQKNNGGLHIKSQQGEGSIFSVTLPCRQQ